MRSSKQITVLLRSFFGILMIGAISAASVKSAELNSVMINRMADALAGRRVAGTEAQLGAGDFYNSHVRMVPVVISNDLLGSGIVVKNGPDALVVTNNHIVSSALKVLGKPTVSLLFYEAALKDKLFDPDSLKHCLANPDPSPWCAAVNRQTRTAMVIATDEDHDLALLQVDDAPEGLPTAKPEDESKLPEPGDDVAVIGHPLNSLWSYATGIVGNVIYHYPLGSGYGTVIQTQVPLNRGNSGGPMFRSDGRWVGVVVSAMVSDTIAIPGSSTHQIPGQGLNFAIWIQEVLAFTRDLTKPQ
jgi:S1-C subfamily serine protease